MSQLPPQRNRPPSSQHNRTTTAPCGNGGPSLFRQVQSLPWVKSKPNASTVSLLPLPLASSPVPILTRRWPPSAWQRVVAPHHGGGPARWIIWYCDSCEMQDVLSYGCLPHSLAVLGLADQVDSKPAQGTGCFRMLMLSPWKQTTSAKQVLYSGWNTE